MIGTNRQLKLDPTPSGPRWVAWDGRRVGVRAVLREWDEPAAPWEDTAERHYVRLLLHSGGVLEAFRENGRWSLSGLED